MLLIWLALGAVLGWCFGYSVGRLTTTPSPPVVAGSERRNDVSWKDILLRLVVLLGPSSERKSDSDTTNRERAPNPILTIISTVLIFYFIVVLGTLAVLISVDYIIDSEGLYRTEDIFFKGRLLCLVLGFIIGVLTFNHMDLLKMSLARPSADVSSDSKYNFSRIFLPFGLAVVVLIFFKPQLLDRITSFKAGEIEAKFARQETTGSIAVRVIREKSADTYEGDVISSWADFLDKYATDGQGKASSDCTNAYENEISINETKDVTARPQNGTRHPWTFAKARRYVLKYLANDDVEINKIRLNIACRLFRRVYPVIQEIKRKTDDGETEDARQDKQMLSISFQLKKFILAPDNDDAEQNLNKAFTGLHNRACNEKRSCIIENESKDTKNKVEKDIEDDVSYIIKQVRRNKSSIDPY